MKKLKQINIVNTCFLDEVEPEYLEGIIIVEENKFKGILNKEEESLIFGTISEKEIAVYESVEDKELYTKLYNGKKDNNSYFGNEFACSEFIRIGTKESQITLEDIENLNIEEIKLLENKINSKSKNIKKETKYFYDKIFKTVKQKSLLYSKK